MTEMSDLTRAWLKELEPADGKYQLTIPAGAQVHIVTETASVRLIGTTSGLNELTVTAHPTSELYCPCDHDLMHGFCNAHMEPPRWSNGVKSCDCPKYPRKKD